MKLTGLDCSICDRKNPRKIKIRMKDETNLFTIYLSRGVGVPGAYSVSKQQLISTDDVVIKSENGHQMTFEPIGMITFVGSVLNDNVSGGHYSAILKTKNGNYFLSNDNSAPIQKLKENISKNTIMQIYKRIK